MFRRGGSQDLVGGTHPPWGTSTLEKGQRPVFGCGCGCGGGGGGGAGGGGGGSVCV